MRYRTRPVEVEAERFYGLGHSEPVPAGVCFCAIGKRFGEGEAQAHCHTIQGPVQANVGDYIVKGEGEHWPVEPNRFRAKYEPVDA